MREECTDLFLSMTFPSPTYLFLSMTFPSPTDVMKFDNSYSWTRSKEVFYSVKLLPPDTELSVPQMAAEEDGTGEEEEFYECGDGPEDRTVQNGDPSPVGDPNPMS